MNVHRFIGKTSRLALLLLWIPAWAQDLPGGEILPASKVSVDAVNAALAPPALTRQLKLRTERPEPPRKLGLLVTFLTNSSALAPAFKKQLDVVASAMKGDRLAGLRFTIEGHADRRGDPAANMALSVSRAQSVRAYLVAAGVEDDRLHVVGKGDTEPVNLKDIAAPENRRVTFITEST